MANEIPQYIDPIAGQTTGLSSSLSPWAGPYVTGMLGRGEALSNLPYTAYQGPLTAGPSALQTQAYQGLGALQVPDYTQTTYAPTSFTAPGVAQSYMSPYLQASLDPQIKEAQRQAEIARVQQAGRLAKAGAYGGGRQAIMESELTRNLMDTLAGITGRGYQTAYEQGATQFNTEEGRRQAAAQQAQQYGLNVLQAQQQAGAAQRGIEQEGVLADIAQFKEERDYPYKQVQYMQSLLQGLPIATQEYSYVEPSTASSLMGGLGSLLGIGKEYFGETDWWKRIFGG